MKKIILSLLVAVFLSSPPLFAANKRCGLGSKIFGKSKGALSQSSELQTNRVFSGSASIAYGTSGCKHNGHLISDPIGQNQIEQLYYVNANFEELMLEMASGKGELLVGFAETLGCKAQVTPVFFEMTRKNYPEIFNFGAISPEDLLNQVKLQIQENPTLRLGCESIWT